MTRPPTSRTSRALAALATSALTLSLTAAVVVTSEAPATAKDDGLARTPPMGFNNWNDTGCAAGFNEAYVKAMADLMESTGLKDAGYEYLNLDDCWARPQNSPEGSRDAEGHLVPDPVRFPNGIDAVADYVHSKGLKFGIYTDRGTRTCNTQGFDGALGADWEPGDPTYEYTDAQDFADWGVDYLKYDNCNNQGLDAEERYTIMRDALEATGRDIVYSICEWGQNDPWLWGADVGHLWRTTGDISANYGSMSSIAKHNLTLAEYAGPGHWNDPDMLQVGNGTWGLTEQRTHFSLWSIMAAPLLIGTDLREATPQTMEILLNEEVIAVDQDPLGIQGDLVRPATDGHYVVAKPLENGDVAVALWNDTAAPARIETTASAVGLPAADTYLLRDLWAHQTVESAGTIGAAVPAHGTVMYRVSAGGNPSAYPPNTSTVMSGLPGRVLNAQESNVTVSFTNDGVLPTQQVRLALHTPADWTVTPTSPTRYDSVESDQTVTATYDVDIPAPTRAETVTVRATADYRWRGTKRATSSTSQDVALDVLPPGFVYVGEGEAWWNTFSGSTRSGNCPACSGGQKLRFIGNSPNNYVVFTDVTVDAAGDYPMLVDYTLDGSRSFWISVNGGPGVELPMTGTSWDDPATVETAVHLEAGTNTVKFYNDTAYAPDLDRIRIAELGG
jgi:alpha-galactosidase